MQLHRFDASGGMPNSPLPLVVWKGGLPLAARRADLACRLYEANGWGGTWVYTVYPYWHFHTKGHEVLSCVAGTARIGLGGDDGIVADVSVGDVIVIPAGVGHKRIAASPGFQMAGGYPPGQTGDIVRPGEISLQEAAQAIAKLALPKTDPISGKADGVAEIWRTQALE